MPLTFEAMQQDRLVMAVARALAVANEAAAARGVDPANSLVTIAEEPSVGDRLWRVQYGARDYVNRRGGDLAVIVEEKTGTVRQIVRGQ